MEVKNIKIKLTTDQLKAIENIDFKKFGIVLDEDKLEYKKDDIKNKLNKIRR